LSPKFNKNLGKSSESPERDCDLRWFVLLPLLRNAQHTTAHFVSTRDEHRFGFRSKKPDLSFFGIGLNLIFFYLIGFGFKIEFVNFESVNGHSIPLFCG